MSQELSWLFKPQNQPESQEQYIDRVNFLSKIGLLLFPCISEETTINDRWKYITSFDEAYDSVINNQYRVSTNIGIICGSRSRLVAIRVQGDYAKDSYQRMFGYTQTLTITKPGYIDGKNRSEAADYYLFRTYKQYKSGVLSEGVKIYAEESYIVSPGTRYPNTNFYYYISDIGQNVPIAPLPEIIDEYLSTTDRIDTNSLIEDLMKFLQGPYYIALGIIEQVRDIMVITDPNESTGYIYSDEHRLWLEASERDFIGLITDLCVRNFRSHLDYAKTIYRGAMDESLRLSLIKKTIPKQLEALSKPGYARCVLDYLGGRKEIRGIYDRKFSSLLNHNIDLLPILDNMVVDLSTGKTRERTKEDMFSRICPVRLTNKPLDVPEKIFSQIMSNDQQMTRFLQKMLGYFLSGRTDARALFIWWGSGGNGKGTINRIMYAILDEFYVQASKDVFIKGKAAVNGAATAHLIPLIGSRLAVYAESEESERLNEGQLKSITGNDRLTARPLYKQQVTFKPICKMVMETNHKPIFDVTDKAIIDRLFFVPFLNKFTADREDISVDIDEESNQIEPDFVQTLIDNHLDEFFTWIVQGAIEYYRRPKFIMPKIMRDELNVYLEELDDVGRFISERCDVSPELRETPGVLYDAFLEYMKIQSSTLTPRAFGNMMVRKGWKKDAGKRYYLGLKAKNDSLLDVPI